MSEITHLTSDGVPSSHETDNAPSTLYPTCWETTQYLEAEETRTRYATQPFHPKYLADPNADSLTEDEKLSRKIAATTNRELHARYHQVSGRVGPDDPCDWATTHDSEGTRIVATTIGRVTPDVPTRPDGLSNVHTCHGHWVGSGRLTADEERSLKTADREYSKANFAVWDAEEAVDQKMPGAEEALTLAKEKKHTAFFSKMDFRGSLQIKYTGCFTCKIEAITASQAEERLVYVISSQRTSDEEDEVPTE